MVDEPDKSKEPAKVFGITPGKKDNWLSFYPENIRLLQTREGLYLLSLMVLSPIVLVIVVCYSKEISWLPHCIRYFLTSSYIAGWFGGLMGGTVFATKWLYKSVAGEHWTEDRHLWRYLSPIISASLALVVICMIKSGLFFGHHPHFENSLAYAFSIAFMIGYFSDKTVGKLSQLIDTLFGK